MKKVYEAPLAEAIKFEYKDQIIASSGGAPCQNTNSNPVQFQPCTHWTQTKML